MIINEFELKELIKQAVREVLAEQARERLTFDVDSFLRGKDLVQVFKRASGNTDNNS